MRLWTQGKAVAGDQATQSCSSLQTSFSLAGLFVALFFHFRSTQPFLNLVKLPKSWWRDNPGSKHLDRKLPFGAELTPFLRGVSGVTSQSLAPALKRLAMNFSTLQKHDKDILCQRRGRRQLPRRRRFSFGSQQSGASCSNLRHPSDLEGRRREKSDLEEQARQLSGAWPGCVFFRRFPPVWGVSRAATQRGRCRWRCDVGF